jgi:hypothetical protein
MIVCAETFFARTLGVVGKKQKMCKKYHKLSTTKEHLKNPFLLCFLELADARKQKTDLKC